MLTRQSQDWNEGNHRGSRPQKAQPIPPFLGLFHGRADSPNRCREIRLFRRARARGKEIAELQFETGVTFWPRVSWGATLLGCEHLFPMIAAGSTLGQLHRHFTLGQVGL
jgi:hypothetical protein